MKKTVATAWFLLLVVAVGILFAAATMVAYGTILIQRDLSREKRLSDWENRGPARCHVLHSKNPKPTTHAEWMER